MMGEAGTPPDDFDWDVWLGSAATRPYHKHLFHKGGINFEILVVVIL